jgi:hypothetical protein
MQVDGLMFMLLFPTPLFLAYRMLFVKVETTETGSVKENSDPVLLFVGTDTLAARERDSAYNSKAGAGAAAAHRPAYSSGGSDSGRLAYIAGGSDTENYPQLTFN